MNATDPAVTALIVVYATAIVGAGAATWIVLKALKLLQKRWPSLTLSAGATQNVAKITALVLAVAFVELQQPELSWRRALADLAAAAGAFLLSLAGHKVDGALAADRERNANGG
jgi:predicted permease